MLTRKEYEVLTLRKKNLTQVQVASELKITQAAVSKFERTAISKIINSMKIIEIARKLDIKIEEELMI